MPSPSTEDMGVNVRVPVHPFPLPLVGARNQERPLRILSLSLFPGDLIAGLAESLFP